MQFQVVSICHNILCKLTSLVELKRWASNPSAIKRFIKRMASKMTVTANDWSKIEHEIKTLWKYIALMTLPAHCQRCHAAPSPAWTCSSWCRANRGWCPWVDVLLFMKSTLICDSDCKHRINQLSMNQILIQLCQVAWALASCSPTPSSPPNLPQTPRSANPPDCQCWSPLGGPW